MQRSWMTTLFGVLLATFACSSSSRQETTGKVTPPTTEPATPAAGACTTDGDCRLFSDYCTACDCRVLAKDAKEPTCSGPGVKCVADPCMTKTAVCEAGTCTVTARAP